MAGKNGRFADTYRQIIAFIAAAFMIVMLVSEGALKDISTGDMAGILSDCTGGDYLRHTLSLFGRQTMPEYC